MSDKASELKALQHIPGVGKSIAKDLWNLDIHAVDDLKGRDPDVLYNALCNQNGVRVDRCMLYVIRCAVYYASNMQHDPELLKWWNWKDRAEQPAQAAPIASSA